MQTSHFDPALRAVLLGCRNALAVIAASAFVCGLSFVTIGIYFNTAINNFPKGLVDPGGASVAIQFFRDAVSSAQIGIAALALVAVGAHWTIRRKEAGAASDLVPLVVSCALFVLFGQMANGLLLAAHWRDLTVPALSAATGPATLRTGPPR